MDDILQDNEDIEGVIGKTKKRKNTRLKQMSADDMFESIKNEVNNFKALVQTYNDSRTLCQCSSQFPKTVLRKMSINKLSDIHGFSYLNIDQLSWTCPRTGHKTKVVLLDYFLIISLNCVLRI